jgi:hypothetical protein
MFVEKLDELCEICKRSVSRSIHVLSQQRQESRREWSPCDPLGGKFPNNRNLEQISQISSLDSIRSGIVGGRRLRAIAIHDEQN